MKILKPKKKNNNSTLCISINSFLCTALKLMCELRKGEISGEQNGWLSEEEVEKLLKEKFDLNIKF